MNTILFATQNNTFIIGDVARLFGFIMNGIYNFCDSAFGIENIGLTIILFTFIAYTLMLPLTIKQQKFSKLSAKMNPEIMAIQNKYKGKTDQNSMLAMQEETKAVYEKYGTSPTGGCLQLFIQLPVIWALYKVIYNVPAYVTSVKNAYSGLVSAIMATDGFQTIMAEFGEPKGILASKFDYAQSNTIIDVLYKFQSSDWATLTEKFPNLSDLIASTSEQVNHMNTFIGGINIGDAPATNILSVAILVPILAGLTQWINTKLMPQPEQQPNAEASPMAASMKTMNVTMPIMSAVFCFTLPVGIGLYWIAGSVFRCIQQIIINKYMDRLDVDALVKKNIEKANAKRKKMGLPEISANAKANVKNINNTGSKANNNVANTSKKMTKEERDEALKKATEYYNSGKAKPGSITAKANMVKQYNDRNAK